MGDSVRNRIVSFNTAFEGFVEWMYLDQKSKVTVGIGRLIDNPDQAVQLGGFVHKTDGSPATEQEIRNEWQMVKNSKTPGKWYELKERTNLRLPRSVIERQALQYAEGIVANLKRQGYDWDNYPADGQLGLLSIGWIGLGSYPKCLGYVKKGNWFYAAGEATFPTSKKREEAQQKLFRNAGRVKARGLDPDVLWFDNPTAGRAFFFKGDKYLTYDIANNRIITPPALIDSWGDPTKDWKGMAAAGFANNLDAAVNWCDGRVFFFKGNEYVRFDIHPGQVSWKLPIAGNWPGLNETGFDSGITAALDWG